MIVQAEHIPVHLGAMPEAVAAVMARDPEPGEVYVDQRPVHGRHAPARTSRSSRAIPCGFAVLARAPRRRRRHGAGEPARRLDRHLPGRPRAAAGAARRRAADGAAREHAQPRRAPRRPRGTARGPPARRAAPRRSSSSGAAPTRSPTRWTSSTATPSASSARRSPGFRTAATRRTTPRAGGGRARAPGGRDDRGRRDRRSTSPDVAAARGQPQLPARRHEVGLLLRRPLPDRARPSLFRRRVRARPRDGPGGLGSSTRCRRLRSSPATRRRRAASSTSSSPLSARRSRCLRRARGR